MNQLFQSKHVIVTGGAKGIGRCICEAFLREGAAVSIIDVDKEAGERQKDKHKELRFFHGDVADKTVLENFVSSLDSPADCLVNNACLSRRGLLQGGILPTGFLPADRKADCSYDDFEYVQRVGVTAPYYLTSLLIQTNKLAEGAAIINIASTRAFQSQANTESYSAAKGGIYALTHAMAISLAGRARVNSISPGWIDTAAWHEGKTVSEHSEQDKRQHPAGRVGRPEDIAEMVLYLCSDKAGFITGENITIDGGMSLLMVYHGDRGWSLK